MVLTIKLKYTHQTVLRDARTADYSAFVKGRWKLEIAFQRFMRHHRKEHCVVVRIKWISERCLSGHILKIFFER